MRKILVFLLFLSAVFLSAAVLIADKNRLKEGSFPADEKVPAKDASGFVPAAPGADLPAADKNCDLSAYGMDCAIAGFLEKNLAWTAAGGVDFCSYEEFFAPNAAGKIYLNAACEEFFESNGKIYIGSGTQTPAMITDSGGVKELWTPRDGGYNSSDVRAVFPDGASDAALNFEGYDRLHKINMMRAEKYFGLPIDYKVSETLKTGCFTDLDCLTPGEYLMMSNCRYISLCLAGKCAVVCPNYYISRPASDK